MNMFDAILKGIFVFFLMVGGWLAVNGVTISVPLDEIEQKINTKLFQSVNISKYTLTNKGATVAKGSETELLIGLSAKLEGLKEPVDVAINAKAGVEMQNGKLVLKSVRDTQFSLMGGVKVKLLEAIAAPVLTEPLEQNIIKATNGIVLSDLNTKDKWWANFVKFATIKSISDEAVSVKISLF